MSIGGEETGIVETFPIEITQFLGGQTLLNIKFIYSNESSGPYVPDIMRLIGYRMLFPI